MNRRTFLQSALAAACAPGALARATTLPSITAGPRSLLIVGWDGAGYNNLIPLLNQGRLPNLASLTAGGGEIAPVDVIGWTRTAPVWTQYFTGLSMDQSGVTGNRCFRSVRRAAFARYDTKHRIFHNMGVWVRQVPAGLTLMSHMKRLGYRTGWITAKSILSSDPAMSPLAEMVLTCDLGATHYPSVEGNDYLQNGVTDALQFVRKPGRWCLFLHQDPDIFGHRYGEDSKRYRHEFVRCDTALGQLLNAVDLSTTAVLVLSDHGFDKNGFAHMNAPDAWVATNLPLKKMRATSLDVYPTLQQALGIVLGPTAPVPRGRSLLS